MHAEGLPGTMEEIIGNVVALRRPPRGAHPVAPSGMAMALLTVRPVPSWPCSSRWLPPSLVSPEVLPEEHLQGFVRQQQATNVSVSHLPPEVLSLFIGH